MLKCHETSWELIDFLFLFNQTKMIVLKYLMPKSVTYRIITPSSMERTIMTNLLIVI